MKSDVQDILGTSVDGGDQVNLQSLMSSDQKKKKSAKKATEQTFKRPDGMHRELYNLLVSEKSEVPPLIPAWNHSASKLAAYRNPKAKLGLKKFLDIPKYTSQEYDQWLRVPSWTREETDHLMELAELFDLRWIIMRDRWDRERFPERSTEDLKERYYGIVNSIRKAQAPADIEPTLVYFDADHERRRKEQLEKLWNRTDEQAEEEEELLQELKKIEARRKERERKAQDLQKLITAADRTPIPATSTGGSGALKKKTSKLIGRPSTSGTSLSVGNLDIVSAGLKFPEFKGVGPHMRSQEMKVTQQVGQKKAKALEQALEKLQLEPNPYATEAIVKDFNELRSDIILLYELKGALGSCEYELEALRHQYKAVTGKQLEIPARVRVSQDFDSHNVDKSANKRKITQAMDLGGNTQPPRRKKVTTDAASSVRRLRRT